MIPLTRLSSDKGPVPRLGPYLFRGRGNPDIGNAEKGESSMEIDRAVVPIAEGQVHSRTGCGLPLITQRTFCAAAEDDPLKAGVDGAAALVPDSVKAILTGEKSTESLVAKTAQVVTFLDAD